MPIIKIIDGHSLAVIKCLRSLPIGEKKKLYHKYLETDYWRRLRLRIYFLAGKKCEICGASNQKLSVHHRSYDRIGEEEETDLILLCDSCHIDKHDRKREKSQL